MAERELGELLAPTDSARRLRDTLRTYLRLNCNREATARALGVHANTVRYRIGQLREHLGEDFEQRHLKLELALETLEN
ncbi:MULTISPECIES: helix-turn-helix domain-containing protein [unclassified Streptomyces]|uniref:helix-turn-helix domain-containing protein n=1 Tax=unclassified Streptomyces TaxID=2593676 RepID=UPI002366AC46|nr:MULTISPECIES: helix-turn-helix domain-containing protein [unclassified Streptomyces]MDF3144730.1 helix-turn-helix domain-containing protein [Streptomyces sp. T21Q-yed]WDF44532.1 helix-turn-helix domain-containing protein [Streptomyces sp. T12]